MFDGVIIAPARVLGSPRNTNPINIAPNLPLGNRPIVLTDRFPDTIGKKSEVGPRHVHDTSIIAAFNISQLNKDSRNQKVADLLEPYNLVSFPFTEPGPIFDGPIYP